MPRGPRLKPSPGPTPRRIPSRKPTRPRGPPWSPPAGAGGSRGAAAGGDDDVDPAVVGVVEEAVGLVEDEVADVGEGEVGRDADVVDEAAGSGDEDVCGGEGRGLALEGGGAGGNCRHAGS